MTKAVRYGLVVLLLFVVGITSATSPKGVAELPSDLADSLRRTYRHSDAVQRLSIYRDTVAAREIWLDLVAEDSTYAPALHYLSTIDHNIVRASMYAERAVAADSTNKWYMQNHAMLLIRTGRLSEALTAYRRLLRLDNSEPTTYHALALLYDANGMPYSAISILDSAELRLGYATQLSDIKQDMLMRTGQYDRVITEGEKILAERPYDIELHQRLANAYEASGRDTLAAKMLDKAYRIDTTNLSSIVAIADYYNRHDDFERMFAYETRLFRDSRLSVEDKLRRLGQYVSDTKFYYDNFFRVGGIIVALSLDYPENREVKNYYASHLLAAGEEEQALDYLRRHLDHSTTTPEDYIAVIQLEYAFSESADVERLLDEAMERFPQNIDISSYAAFFASEKGDKKGAVKMLHKTLKLCQKDEERSMIWGYIGDIYHEMGDDKQCFKAYDKALAYNDENILVLNNYAYFLSLLDRELLVAMSYATTANKLSPNNATYLDTLAWVMHRVGSNEEAKRIMQQALSIDGQRDPDLLAHYGDILWALGEKFMAETYWKKAVERGYDSQRMEEHIAQLKTEPKHDK